jgi:hypothetical protein
LEKIKLTRGKYTIVDDEDYDFLMHFKWYPIKSPKDIFYAVSWCKYGTIYMHRIVLELEDPKIHIDHIDRDGLNNQKSNLRMATHAQNQHNVPFRRDNTSGYKGVSFYKPYNKYIAHIQFNGKNIHLGYYDTAIEAAMAYDEAAKELHGDFSNLNFK